MRAGLSLASMSCSGVAAKTGQVLATPFHNDVSSPFIPADPPRPPGIKLPKRPFYR
jgi:hypothetical protein